MKAASLIYTIPEAGLPIAWLQTGMLRQESRMAATGHDLAWTLPCLAPTDGGAPGPAEPLAVPRPVFKS